MPASLGSGIYPTPLPLVCVCVCLRVRLAASPLQEYQNRRGGRVVLGAISMPDLDLSASEKVRRRLDMLWGLVLLFAGPRSSLRTKSRRMDAGGAAKEAAAQKLHG